MDTKVLSQLLDTVPHDDVVLADRAEYAKQVQFESANVIELVKLRAKLVEKTEDEHALDGAAHHKFNVLRSLTPDPPISRPCSVSKVTLLASVPSLFDVEVEWRTAAPKNVTLETALKYWDAVEDVDVNSSVWVSLLDRVESQLPSLGSIRQSLSDACVETVPGPMRSEFDRAGIADVTFDDVRESLRGRV